MVVGELTRWRMVVGELTRWRMVVGELRPDTLIPFSRQLGKAVCKKYTERLLLVPEPLLEGFGTKLEEQFLGIILSANVHAETAEHFSKLGEGVGG